MQICIVVTQVLVIFWCKKNGIFTLKNEILKQADFASNWRKSRFRGLEIYKIFRERKPPDPPTGEPPKVAPFHRTPLLKTWIRPSIAPTKYFMLNFFNAIEGSYYSVVAFSKWIPKYYAISKISTNQTRELDYEVANQVSDPVFNFSGKAAMASIVKKK